MFLICISYFCFSISHPTPSPTHFPSHNRRSQEEQQVQLAAHVPVHDGRHDHTAGVRRARPVGRQSADHRQARVGPVRHRRSEEAVRRRPRHQPRVRDHARRRPLPQESSRRADRRGRFEHGVQLVHARVRGAHPEHHVQRGPSVNRYPG